MVVADIRDKSRRSTQQHDFIFVMLNILFEAQEYFKDFDTYRKCLLIKLGFCDVYKFKDGTMAVIAHSLKFGKGGISQEEANRLTESILDFAVSIGFDRDVLLSQTRDRVGAFIPQ